MPMRPPHPCTQPGCPTLVYGRDGRCPDHLRKARKASDRWRYIRDAKMYGKAHRQRFRPGVLRRDPYCACDLTDHPWHLGRCVQPSTDADHWPIGKRELIRRGLDSDDPQYGRGLCHRCHSSSTAQIHPGGWHKPRVM